MTKKLELLERAKKLKLEVSSKNTISEISAAIEKAEANLKPEKVAKIEKDTATTNEASVAESGTAKAGKRSEKALKEVEEKIAKEERKEKHDTAPQSDEVTSHVKKGSRPITRPKLRTSRKKLSQSC